jgi:hypothetical protein
MKFIIVFIISIEIILMPSLMFRKLSLLFKGLGAVRTFERLEAGVNSEMVFEVAPLIELSAAFSTYQNLIEPLRVIIDILALEAKESIDKYFFTWRFSLL